MSLQRSLQYDDSDRAESLRQFFARVDDIRTFGSEELGLKIGKSYTRYLELEQDYLVAVVNATAPHSLSPYLWSYPIIGDAPYRGYYDPDHARQEADRLEQEGYEVWVRKVDAFSSLGIVSDPLISFMQNYSEFRLAELIFHEQMHATIWVANAVQFNEELAATFDTAAALEYLSAKYGANSPEIQDAQARISDSAQFLNDMKELAQRLEEFFATSTQIFGEGAEVLPSVLENYPPQFIAERNQIIDEFKQDFAETYADRYLSENYRTLSELEINNAYISLFQTYSERQNLFAALLEQNSGLADTIAVIRNALNKPSDFGIDYRPGEDPIKVIEGLLRIP